MKNRKIYFVNNLEGIWSSLGTRCMFKALGDGRIRFIVHSALQVLGAALSIGSLAYLTIALGEKGYGRYSWVVALGGFIGLFLQAGIPLTLAKELTLNRRLKLDAVNEVFTATAFLAAALLTFVLASFAALFREVPLVFFSLPLAFAVASLSITVALLRATGLTFRAQLAEQLGRTVLLLALISVASSGFGVVSVRFAVLCYCAACLFMSASFILWEGRLYFSPECRPRLMGVSFSHFQSSLSKSIANYLPVIISGFFFEPRYVAYLAVGLQITAPLNFGLVSARSIYGYRINQKIADGDVRAASRLFRNAILASNGVALLGAGLLFAILLSPLPSLDIFLDRFSDPQLAKYVLIIFCAHRLAQVAPGPIQLVAVFRNHEIFLKWLNLSGLIVLGCALVCAGLAKSVVGVPFAALAYSLYLSVALSLYLAFKT